MSYLTHVPPPPLSRFVALFWVHEGFAPAHPRERVLPTGTVELVISLAGTPLRVCEDGGGARVTEDGALVCGAHSRPFVIDTADPLPTLGVHFRPGGAWPFFGVPAGALADAHVSLGDLWGPAAAAELRERLLGAPDHPARFRILEAALLARAGAAPTGHLAVRLAVRELQSATRPDTIRQVTERIGVSHRHFVQLFRREVGLAPKVFWRVQRFQDVLRATAPEAEVDWSRVALACGFYDQAHFIHDFRAFSGLTPSAYLRQRTEHLNHLRLDPG